MQSDSCWQERVPEGAGPGPETPQVCVCVGVRVCLCMCMVHTSLEAEYFFIPLHVYKEHFLTVHRNK